MDWTIQNLLLVVVALVVLGWYLKYLWRRRNLYIYSWSVPGPFAVPIIGAAYKLLGNPDDILDKANIFIDKYPSPVKVWFGPQLIYCLSDPRHVEKVLTSQKCLAKNYLYKFVIMAIGTGLATAPVPKWKKHRRLIMPSFNQKILNSFVNVFAEQADIFTEILKGHVGSKDIDINKFVMAMMMDIICETAMGLKMDTQKGNNQFATHFERLAEITTLRIFRVWHHLDWTWRLFPLSREFDKHVEGLHDVTNSVIRKKLKELKQKEEYNTNSLTAKVDEDDPKKRLAFLDLILENSEFTEDELRDEVEIFMMAGTDTSGTTTCFMLEMLGLHPEIQQKVYEEVIDVLGEDRRVEASDISKFEYLEMVIKETMRLFPIVSGFMRSIEEDINLGNCILPQGSSACFSTLSIHRNPLYWPDPLKFDPDRFLPEEVAKRHPCSFIPFSYGPRNCIGSKYAMMSMKTIAATTIRKYSVFTQYRSVEEIEVKTKVALRPKFGHKVYLELR